MTIWGLVGAAYGLVLAGAAITQPVSRRHLAFAASCAYALACVATGTLTGAFWANLLAPGGLLLTGYWLSGLFFRDPQPWLEAWLLHIDSGMYAQRWMHWLPRPFAELLELGYALDYVVIGGGAIYTATFGTDQVGYYWSLVLAAELASFAPMPWLRSRPPRTIEAAAPRPLVFRRLNTSILDTASVQANTLPSGHVSGATAAALGVMAVDVVVGSWLLIAAGLIAIAAVAGRYHYVIDCAAGAVVAVTVWLAMPWGGAESARSVGGYVVDCAAGAAVALSSLM